MDMLGMELDRWSNTREDASLDLIKLITQTVNLSFVYCNATQNEMALIIAGAGVPGLVKIKYVHELGPLSPPYSQVDIGA
jgi:hypothetical protein